MLQEQRCDALVMHAVRHGERDLGVHVGYPLVAGAADDLSAAQCEQRSVPGPRLAADPAGLLPGSQ